MKHLVLIIALLNHLTPTKVSTIALWSTTFAKPWKVATAKVTGKELCVFTDSGAGNTNATDGVGGLTVDGP